MSTAHRIVITFVMGIAIFLGVPFLAWGVTDIPAFLEHPARLLYVILVLILNAFAAVRIPEVGKRRGERKTIVQRQHIAVVLLQIFSLSVVLIGPYSDRHGLAVIEGSPALRYAGLTLYLVGFLIMHFAEAFLGKQFSVEVAIQEGHRLITSGPYRYLRHPRYAGIAVFVGGIALVFRSWLGLVLDVMVIAVLLWRIRDEEALMRQEFGPEWDAYSAKTWRLVPFVY